MNEKIDTKRRHSGKYVYDCLREEILTLQLKPNTQLDEISLAERFEVSRSPVRDALARLVAEGLATTLPNRTTIVTPFNVENFPHYINALDLLQRAVTRLAAIYRSESDLQKIRHEEKLYIQAVEKNDYKQMVEQNKHLHIAIAQASQNAYLTEYYAKLLEEGQRLLYLQFDHLFTTGNLSPHEHDKMVSAIVQQNADEAEQAANEHSILFRERFVAYMQRNTTENIEIVW